MEATSLFSPLSDQANDIVPSTEEPNDQYRTCSYKRNHPKRLLIKLSPGQVAFRFLIHVSSVGSVIGNHGAIVSRIRQETATRIHLDELVPGSDHRVVLVAGSGSVMRKISLNNEEEERQVSSAQEAMLRVFERVWEMEAQNEGGAKGEEVWCKLLAHKSQVGALMGRGGKNITRVRNESGAKVRVLNAPFCTAKDDDMIQISGSLLAVKKALIDVSTCLQDRPLFDKGPTYIRKAQGGSPSDPHSEFFPHLTSLLAHLPGHTIVDDGVHQQDKKRTEQEVVFRLLCSNDVAGCVIGKKGSIVRALQNEAGASIMFAPPLTESGERVVTISAMENLESRYSPAQNAVVLVFARTIEGAFGWGLNQRAPVTARLLVASDLVGCLSCKESRVLSEMREVTGADIQILEGEQILNPPAVNDVVVQITGEYKSVQNALFQVTGSLRDNLLPSEVVKEMRARNPCIRVSEDPLKDDHFPYNIDCEHAFVTKTTVEIVISEHAFGSVDGEDGSNLNRIRQISGAKVEVHDPCRDGKERRVIISGTPDETLAAQSLLQASLP